MALSGSLNFLTASELGSAITSGTRYWYTANSAAGGFIPVDFAGLNTIIFEKMTGSTNTLGYDTDTPIYEFSTAVESSYINTAYIKAFLGGTNTKGTPAYGQPRVFNALMHHRNGPYQHPMWKQYRGGDHPVARHLRLSNTMSIDQSDPDPVKRQNNKRLMSFYNEQNDSLPGDGVFEHISIPAEAIPSMYPSLKQYYEPAVVSHHKPIVFDADVGGASAKVRMSLLNQMTFFSNQGLNNALKIASADPTTGSSAGFKRKNQNMYEMLHAAKALGGQNFIYSEQLFPKQLNLYRTFKTNRPNYEEVSGLGPNGYDRESGTHRMFWKVSQGGNTSAATSDGTTRLRSNFTALNSQGIIQDSSVSGTGAPHNDTFQLQLLSGSTPWNPTVFYVTTGIVTNQINTVTGGLDSDGNVRPNPSGAFSQLEAYQPYPLALLSSWPLDPRSDIYDSPHYLTSSIGGKGLQIGLTPHSSTSSFISMSQADKMALNVFTMITRSAGELAYSTKPTLYFRGISTLPVDESGNVLFGGSGYPDITASLQYNRHTFPYNTPFYATSKVRGRDPMFNSYDDFKEGQNLKFAGRDFSIIPEFKMADHLDYYLSRFVSVKDFQLFRALQTSDYADGPKHKKILRTAFVGPDNRTNHKLNFLVIDGADVTASSAQENFSTSDPTTDLFTYDDGDLLSAPTNTGLATADHNYASDATAVKFLERYSHTENLINFSHLMEQNGNAFVNDVNTIPSKIKFTCQGIKKLLPYNGFYPVLRTVQIGNAFKSAFYPFIDDVNPAVGQTGRFADNADAVDNPKNGALQTFLEAFMAPGILYNSIKSGIAVDYPVYFRDQVEANNVGQEPYYYLPELFVSGPLDPASPDITPPNLSGTVQGIFSQSFNYGGGYMMGISRCMPAVLNSLFSRRFKFESLYDLKQLDSYQDGYIIGVSDFVDLDRMTTGSACDIGYSDDGYGDPQFHAGVAYYKKAPYATFTKKPSEIKSAESMIYESSINNFLCETMEFFLEDVSGPGVKLPVATSLPKKNNISIDSQTTYYMEVTLRMGRTQVMCEGPRDAGIGKATFKGNSYTGSAMMRGYIYGPPMETVPHHTNTSVQRTAIGDSGSTVVVTASIGSRDFESYLGANLQDPAYHAYTPPYFYGDSNLIMAYTGSNNALLENKVSYKVGITDLFRGAQADSFYSEQYVTGAIDGDINGRLCAYMPPKEYSSGLEVPISGTFPRMKIESSIDIFNEPVRIVSDQGANEYEMLYIAPKWVCPVLDFSSSISAVENKVLDNNQLTSTSSYTTVTNTYHDVTTGKGMWGGYGTDPYDQNALAATGGDLVGKGIYLEIGDSFKDRYVNEQDNTLSQQATSSARGAIQSAGLQSLDSFYKDRYALSSQNRTDSLMKKLGFNQQALPIGKFAKQREVSEAIVVIPYFDKKIDIKAATEQASAATNGGFVNTGVDSLFPGGELYSTREIIPGKHFLPVHKTLFENVLSVILAEQNLQKNDTETKNFIGMSNPGSIQAAKDTDVGQMILKLLGGGTKKGYQLPPEFDFIHNASVNPFQMMVIPMTSTLRKQELIDIYQGIMPDASLDIEKLVNSFSVRPGLLIDSLVAGEEWFPKGKNVPNLSALGIGAMLSPVPVLARQFDSASILEDSIPLWLETSKDFYKNLKFMIFKVKERGEKDYQLYRNSQIATAIQSKLDSLTVGDGAIFDSSNEITNILFDKKVKDVYGANWPYDYFSLIETVKIDVEIEVTE